MPIKNSESNGIDSRRRVLYRNFHMVKHSKPYDDPMKRKRRGWLQQQQPEFKTYLFEISTSHDKRHIFIILFPNYENPQIYLKETLPIKVFGKLLADNEGFFSNFILNQLEIKFGRLWIFDYHGQGRDPRLARTTEMHQVNVQPTNEMQGQDA